MYSNLRSLIFKIDPERAHFLAIQSLKLNLVSNIFDENKNDPILKTKLFNQDLDNPIGIAAGFDKNAEVYNPLFKLGFGFVEVGTVTPLKQYGNEKPRVFRLVEDQALINRLGFNNHGSDTILNRIKSNKKLGVLGVNVGPNKDSNDRLNDYLIGLEKFSEVADYITINISSPNTENLRNFHDENKLKELLPNESFVYLADNINCPYGNKSKKEIVFFSVKNTSKLIELNCKMIIVACNTATTNAIEKLREVIGIPIIGIEPGIKPAISYTKTKNIGILATEKTLNKL